MNFHILRYPLQENSCLIRRSGGRILYVYCQKASVSLVNFPILSEVVLAEVG